LTPAFVKRLVLLFSIRLISELLFSISFTILALFNPAAGEGTSFANPSNNPAIDERRLSIQMLSILKVFDVDGLSMFACVACNLEIRKNICAVSRHLHSSRLFDGVSGCRT
jgi:hypothetical protein